MRLQAKLDTGQKFTSVCIFVDVRVDLKFLLNPEIPFMHGVGSWLFLFFSFAHKLEVYSQSFCGFIVSFL